MFKILLLSIFSIFVFCNSSEAKYNPPPGDYKTRSEILAERYFMKFNTTQDDKMTLEQYEARPLTREDRRNMRRDQSDGVYLNDEEKFKVMDTDGDGFVSQQEMSDYIKKMRTEGRNFY